MPEEEKKVDSQESTDEITKDAENKMYDKEDKKVEEKEEEKKVEEPAKEEKKVEEKKDEEVKYDLKLPENSVLSEDHVEKTVAFAKEQGLSNDAAQKMIDRDNTLVAAKQQDGLDQLDVLVNETWPKQAAEDKEIGGDDFGKNCELAKRVVNKFFDDDFKNLLNPKSEDNPTGVGYGNHPGLVKGLVRIGKVMSDDSLVLGKANTTNEKSDIDKLYDNDTSK